jgi:hypothetical protein
VPSNLKGCAFEVHGDLLFKDFINELSTNAVPRIEAMDPDVGDFTLISSTFWQNSIVRSEDRRKSTAAF